MPVVRVMNWNVQNYGRLRSGIEYNNLDITDAIAKIVVAYSVDILVMLEVNTSQTATSRLLTDIMRKRLNRESQRNGANHYRTAIVSPPTHRECYSFFVRDPDHTRPLCIQPVAGRRPPVIGYRYASLDAVSFARATSPEVYVGGFPLYVPDEDYVSYQGTTRPPPAWPGLRAPALGLFEIRNSGAANALMPIVACHFGAAYGARNPRAEVQFEMLQYLSVLRGVAPGNVPRSIRLNLGGGPNPFDANWALLLGDFNIDFLDDAYFYTPITEGLGMSARIQQNTHLVSLSEYSPRDYTRTVELAINAFDNIFLRVSANGPATVTPGSSRVINIPELVRTRKLTYNKSVDMYTELDRRGFDGRKYKVFCEDYGYQLTSDPRYVPTTNITTALMGARLASDHLPVLTELTVA